jgi:hypothetical protein
MIRSAALLVFLLAMHGPAAAQAPSEPDPTDIEALEGLRAEEDAARVRRRVLAEFWCRRIEDSGRRAECDRVVDACRLPDGTPGMECLAVRWMLRRDEVCLADELKADRVACLERRLDAMIEKLADLPELIDRRIREVFRPRLHKLDR